jgi:hypothetical protein
MWVACTPGELEMAIFSTGRDTMKSRVLAVLAGLFLLPSVALAIPSIVFDTVPGGAGGTMTYDGAGGALIANDIVFVNLSGVESPANAGVTLDCVNCSLDFTTGANVQEGPGQLWQWAGGGSFTLTGDIPALGLVGATLISGTFTATANTPGLAGADPNALFVAIGVDSKDPTLAAFYGFDPANFTFANTEIALGTFTSDPVTGAFSAIPNQADIINTQAVPNPMTMLLVGLGMAGLAVRKQLR